MGDYPASALRRFPLAYLIHDFFRRFSHIFDLRFRHRWIEWQRNQPGVQGQSFRTLVFGTLGERRVGWMQRNGNEVNARTDAFLLQSLDELIPADFDSV